MAHILDSNLHDNMVLAANYVRKRLGEANIGSFTFRVEVEGRTQTESSNCKIIYCLAKSYEPYVKGDKLTNVVDEVIRRHGWEQDHAPLAITET